MLPGVDPGLMKGGSGGILRLKILKFQVPGNVISSILRQSQCVLNFNISFFKVRMSFFLHQNITKLHKNNVNLHLYLTMIKIY